MENNAWQNLKNSVIDVADVASKKAKELTDLAGLEMVLKLRQSDLRDTMRSLGDAYYQSIRFDLDTTEKIATLLAKADYLNAEIEKIKAKMKNVKASNR